MSLRQHLADEAAREAIEQERRLKPLRDAEQTLKQTARELALLERERIRAGKDDSFKIDSAVANASLSVEHANRFNGEQAALFVESTPEYYPSEENQEILTSFLFRNNAQICNSATFKAAFERLHSYGLLQDWPIEPEPESEPIAAPLPIELEQEPHQPIQDGSEIGIDLSTGLERTYTGWQISNMSSDVYRRTFRLRTVNRPGERLR